MRPQTATGRAENRFTTDGSDPTAASALYSGAFNVTSSATLKARAFKSGMNSSAVTSTTFTIAAEAPTIHEILDEFKVSANSRKVVQAMLSGGEFGRPFLVTPGTPPDRVKALRDSFVKVLKDPELLAEAKKARMEVEHTPGEELDTLIKDVLDQPPEVVDQAKKLLGN